jgi:hypothetical protein
MSGDRSANAAEDLGSRPEDTAMDVTQEATLSADKTIGGSAEAGLGSESLDDLGVSVMDQDVLERNVAAQV